MRLDKFLKLSGIIRRRTVAKEVSDAGRVTIDGRPADAASSVRPGQRIRVDFGRKVAVYEILALPDRPVRPGDAGPYVRLVGEEIGEDW